MFQFPTGLAMFCNAIAHSVQETSRYNSNCADKMPRADAITEAGIIIGLNFSAHSPEIT